MLSAARKCCANLHLARCGQETGGFGFLCPKPLHFFGFSFPAHRINLGKVLGSSDISSDYYIIAVWYVYIIFVADKVNNLTSIRLLIFQL